MMKRKRFFGKILPYPDGFVQWSTYKAVSWFEKWKACNRLFVLLHVPYKGGWLPLDVPDLLNAHTYIDLDSWATQKLSILAVQQFVAEVSDDPIKWPHLTLIYA